MVAFGKRRKKRRKPTLMREVDTMSCSIEAVRFFLLYPAVLYSISGFLFTLLFLAHCRTYRTFHPCFAFLFGVAVFFYGFCAFLTVYQLVYFAFGGKSLPIYDYIVTFSYNYISPIILFLTIERVIATVFSGNYERSRPWLLLFISQILATAFAVAHLISGFSEQWSEDDILFAISITCLSILFILFVINSRMVNRNRSDSALTKRYQITENIRVIRILIPLVLFDNFITINDFIAFKAFDVEYLFEGKKCLQKEYIPLFVVMNMISILLEFSIPIAIVLRYRPYYKQFARFGYCRRRVADENACLSIVNVLGKEVNVTTNQEDVFANLHHHWDIIKR